MKNPFTVTPTANRRVRHHSAGMASFLALSRGIESTITLPKEVVALRALQTRCEEFNAQINTVTREAAYREIKAQKAAYAAAPTAENFEKMRSGIVEVGAQMEQNGHVLRSVKAARAKANAEGPVIFIRIIGRALALLDDEIEKLRAAEAQTAEKYGAPFAPSPTVLALENLAYNLADRAAVAAASEGYTSPRSLFQDFVAI